MAFPPLTQQYGHLTARFLQLGDEKVMFEPARVRVRVSPTVAFTYAGDQVDPVILMGAKTEYRLNSEGYLVGPNALLGVTLPVGQYDIRVVYKGRTEIERILTIEADIVYELADEVEFPTPTPSAFLVTESVYQAVLAAATDAAESASQAAAIVAGAFPLSEEQFTSILAAASVVESVIEEASAYAAEALTSADNASAFADDAEESAQASAGILTNVQALRGSALNAAGQASDYADDAEESAQASDAARAQAVIAQAAAAGSATAAQDVVSDLEAAGDEILDEAAAHRDDAQAAAVSANEHKAAAAISATDAAASAQTALDAVNTPGRQGDPGTPGADGEDGRGYDFTGDYAVGTDYKVDDLYISVRDQSLRLVTEDFTSGSPTQADTVYSTLFVPAGAPGEPGTPGTPGVIARQSATYSISSNPIAQNFRAQGTIALAKAYRLLSMTASWTVRVRLYATAAGQSADAARAVGTDAADSIGLIFEYVTSNTTGPATYYLSPQPTGANFDSPVSTTAYITVDVLQFSLQPITVGFTYLAEETA